MVFGYVVIHGELKLIFIFSDFNTESDARFLMQTNIQHSFQLSGSHPHLHRDLIAVAFGRPMFISCSSFYDADCQLGCLEFISSVCKRVCIQLS